MGQKEKSADKTHKVRVLDAAFQDIEDITDFIAIANQQPALLVLDYLCNQTI
jgi:hypothetical protein